MATAPPFARICIRLSARANAEHGLEAAVCPKHGMGKARDFPVFVSHSASAAPGPNEAKDCPDGLNASVAMATSPGLGGTGNAVRSILSRRGLYCKAASRLSRAS